MAIVTMTKNHEQGLKATIARKFNKAKAANMAATAAVMTAVTQIMPVLCDDTAQSALAESVGSLLDTIVLPIMWGAGVVLFIIAAGTFVMAYVDDNNTAGMKKAVKEALGAVVLTILRKLLKGWLASQGVTIS